jgi:hypothetical protein
VSAHEHVCAACGATTRERLPEPRVWTVGSSESAGDARMVVDNNEDVWALNPTSGFWFCSSLSGGWLWDTVMLYAPLVELLSAVKE